MTPLARAVPPSRSARQASATSTVSRFTLFDSIPHGRRGVTGHTDERPFPPARDSPLEGNSTRPWRASPELTNSLQSEWAAVIPGGRTQTDDARPRQASGARFDHERRSDRAPLNESRTHCDPRRYVSAAGGSCAAEDLIHSAESDAPIAADGRARSDCPRHRGC